MGYYSDMQIAAMEDGEMVGRGSRMRLSPKAIRRLQESQSAEPAQEQKQEKPGTRTARILYEHLGEVSYTEKSPRAVVKEGDEAVVDLEEKKRCIFSHDDWRTVEVNRWEIRDVVLPEWLSAEEWLRDPIGWQYLWIDVSLVYAIDDLDEAKVLLPEAWQRGLKDLPEEWRRESLKLLKVKRFRSRFRESLRDQLVEWLETPEGERRYELPFSPRQWEALTRYKRGRRY